MGIIGLGLVLYFTGTESIIYIFLAIGVGIGLYRLGSIVAILLLTKEIEKAHDEMRSIYYNQNDLENFSKWEDCYDKAMTSRLDKM